ncbi:MAG: acetyl-CoA carboxylase biotin carboxyl carrier protein [Trueperaceae bacterium]|nr:MAG: acetyl-CoA carboxylase biotin carboxyl carrier protein [Trueperaceae bacterium]
MDVKDIKKLLDAVAGADVSEFTFETGEYKLSLKRGIDLHQSVAQMSAPQQLPDAISQLLPQPSQRPVLVSEGERVEPEEETGGHHVEVIAPIVGTFYSAPAPDAEPYVKVGDRVSAGTVLCIIEAMKLMNEIEAETVGTVVEVLVRNEEPVEYGQVLFRIDPG